MDESKEDKKKLAKAVRRARMAAKIAEREAQMYADVPITTAAAAAAPPSEEPEPAEEEPVATAAVEAETVASRNETDFVEAPSVPEGDAVVESLADSDPSSFPADSLLTTETAASASKEESTVPSGPVEENGMLSGDWRTRSDLSSDANEPTEEHGAPHKELVAELQVAALPALPQLL
jgi:hypothetical protein